MHIIKIDIIKIDIINIFTNLINNLNIYINIKFKL